MNSGATKKVNIRNQVYDRMKDQTISSAWVPDEKISSGNQPMEVFGVSRGTVCQTTQKLSAVGPLEARGGKGSYVGQLGSASYPQSAMSAAFLNGDELKKVFEFRMLSECGVTGMAAENITDVQIRRLGKNYEKVLQNLGNLEKYIGIDLEFHCLLGECIHSMSVCQIHKTTEDVLVMSIGKGTEMIGFERGREDHGLILRAVQNHDSQTVEEAMRHHIIDHPVLILDAPAETEVDSLVRHI